MSFIKQRIASELSLLKDRAMLRSLKPPEGHDFSSNDYFKLTLNAHLIKAVKEGAEHYGYGSSSSRFIRGERSLYDRLEQRLAHFCHAEAALIFSSGYLANIGVLQALIKKGDFVFSDALNHASIIDGLRLCGAHVVIYPHAHIDFLSKALKEAPKEGAKFIVSESLFSMDGDIAPLLSLAALARSHDAALIVDEAHAIGIYGKEGAGLIEHFGIRDEVLCSINGLGKAFGCFGAFVVGQAQVIELIKQRARTLMYTTALPPLALCAIDSALTQIQENPWWRQTLFTRIERFSELYKPLGLSSPIIPLMLKDNNRALFVSEALRKAGFDVRAIRPPTVPEGTARLRITTNIGQSDELIDEFMRVVRAVL